MTQVLLCIVVVSLGVSSLGQILWLSWVDKRLAVLEARLKKAANDIQAQISRGYGND